MAERAIRHDEELMAPAPYDPATTSVELDAGSTLAVAKLAKHKGISLEEAIARALKNDVFILEQEEGGSSFEIRSGNSTRTVHFV